MATTSAAATTPRKRPVAKKTAKSAAVSSVNGKAGKSAAAKPATAGKPEPAQPKLKLVRDSFTIPKNEYAVLDELKQRAARLMRPTKKGELLRAGIAALQRMPDKAFLAAVNAVPSLKTGRPGSVKPEEGAEAAVASKKG